MYGSLCSWSYYHLFEVSLLEENVPSIEVGKRVPWVHPGGLVVVLHSTHHIPHELVDDTSVCVELGSRT